MAAAGTYDSTTAPTTGYTTRRMHRHDLDLALVLAASEGWNPGLSDAEAFWRVDPQGFHLGLLDGQPVATISAVRYGEQEPSSAPAGFGFVGFYIVRPEHRGKGYGKRLWDRALEDLAGRGVSCVGLDAVLAQVDTYRGVGFELARMSTRYECDGGGKGLIPTGLVPLASVPFAEVLAYDRRCFPARREAFLKAWLSMPGHVGLGCLRGGALASDGLAGDGLGGDGLAGFGLVRPCGLGAKIGPLFAEDEAAAESLLRGLLASAPRGPVFYDAPESNPAAVRLAEAHGMRAVFRTGRMYHGSAPQYDLSREFGVTSFELG